ncbi:hypothetical protein FANTH_604 [Fusarium anthophilum]|uniref:Uncharacterized protein n=1 Tax=Fusarium anthophilum TaxID=48485 RepID=A0A8H4ZYN5_9HYPO|nr:hypothetical protein FANTH_604 [Fusarium anthophilum]
MDSSNEQYQRDAAMPKSQAKKKSPAKGLGTSKPNTKAGTPTPYEFSGRDSINISSFDLAQVQESLEHSDVPSMRPQLKSPRQYPRALNHPMDWQLLQHEFLISRHKALRSSVPSTPSTLPALEPTPKAPETLPLDEAASDSRPPSPGESSTASTKPPVPEIRISPPEEMSRASRQARPPIEDPAYPWEEEELQALEDMRNEQCRLHKETLDAMGQMAYWSFRAQRAAIRVKETMRDLRSYMDKVLAEQEGVQDHEENECTVLPLSFTK